MISPINEDLLCYIIEYFDCNTCARFDSVLSGESRKIINKCKKKHYGIVYITNIFDKVISWFQYKNFYFPNCLEIDIESIDNHYTIPYSVDDFSIKLNSLFEVCPNITRFIASHHDMYFTNNLLKNLVLHCPLLEELEIWDTSATNINIVSLSLPNLKLFLVRGNNNDVSEVTNNDLKLFAQNHPKMEYLIFEYFQINDKTIDYILHHCTFKMLT